MILIYFPKTINRKLDSLLLLWWKYNLSPGWNCANKVVSSKPELISDTDLYFMDFCQGKLIGMYLIWLVVLTDMRKSG